MKARAALVLTLLTASAFALLIPTGVVHGISGNAQLAAVDQVPNPLSVTKAHTVESVIAGTDQVVSIDGVSQTPPKVFAINFSGVTFSGSQFRLYMSQDGLAGLSPGDVQFGPLLNTADFVNATDNWKASTGTLGLGLTGTFYIGSTKSGSHMVAGPIDIAISNGYGFIKVFDGSVVVAAQTIVPQPGITSMQPTPSYGAAGTPVKVVGGGFKAGLMLDINASYTKIGWAGSIKSYDVTWITGLSTGTNGSFTSHSTAILDTGQVLNPLVLGPYPTTSILLFAVNASHRSQVMNSGQKGTNGPVFNEYNRGIAMVTSYSSTGTPVDVTDGKYRHGYLFGNDTGSIGTVGSVTIVDLGTINAQVFGKLYIAGNFSYVGQPVTFWVGTSPGTAVKMNTTAPVVADSNGFWNATVVVPILSGGNHAVWVDLGGVYYGMTGGFSGSTTTTSSSSSSTTTTTTSTTTTSHTSTTATSIGGHYSTPTTTKTTSTSMVSTSSTTTSTSPPTSQSTTSIVTTSSPQPSTSTTSNGGGIPEFGDGFLGAVAITLTIVVAYLVIRSRR